ncbi:MAG: PAS domain-containing protein [Desulfomonile tiedjei]|nr:PAS domain-containing protein [Desulfomonile tiedjei]
MAGYKFISETVEDDEGSVFPLSATVGLSEATVDLGSLLADDVSATGSFDLRRFKSSSIGKLLEAIPIPVFLVDESLRIAFANRASSKLLQSHPDGPDRRFSTLFPNPQDGENGERLVDTVLKQRIPLEVEGFLGQGPDRMLGRIHLRSMRIEGTRYIGIFVEDLRPRGQTLSRD